MSSSFSWNTTYFDQPKQQHYRSPPRGPHTAASHNASLDWMRKTLSPRGPPSRIPEVFVNAERRSHGGQAPASRPGSPTVSYHNNNSSTNRQPVLISEALRSKSPSGPRVSARSWLAESSGGSLMRNNSNNNNSGFVGNGTNRSTSRGRATTSRGGGFSGISISPHRTAHQHCCAQMHSSALLRTVSPGQFASTVRSMSGGSTSAGDASRRAWTPRRLSSSTARRNAPRWGDQHLVLTAGNNPHTSSSSASIADRQHGTATLDANAKFSLATQRNIVQRSAGSTLPVCQTVGTDNSNCSCAEDDRGELMVHSIDLLLRANRNDNAMSPSRQKLVRSSSSPVANRVENIVKREVERRLQRERDLMAEQQRLKDEAAAAKAQELESRNRAALMKAQAEAELASAKLNSERMAREKAESERMAAQENLARKQAEAETEQLRAQFQSLDTKMVSPGKVRVQGSLHPAGNAASAAAAAVSNTKPDTSPSSSSSAAAAAASAKAAPAERNRNWVRSVPEDEDDQFARFNSVRRGAEQSTGAPGSFDPVSSKAIQRAAQMRANIFSSTASAPGSPSASNNNTTPGRTHFAHSPASATSRGEVASVVSQLASAGSSPIADAGALDDDDIDAMSGGAGGSGRRGMLTPGSAARPPAALLGTGSPSYFASSSTLSSTPVIPAPTLSSLAPNFQPRLGSIGGGGMMAPVVGMKERDQHIIELMKRTRANHSAAAAGGAGSGHFLGGNYDLKSSSPVRAYGGGSSSAASRHPQVFVPVADIEQRLAAADAAAPSSSSALLSEPNSADRRLFAAAAATQHYEPSHVFQHEHFYSDDRSRDGESVPRGSLSPLGSASQQRVQPSTSPARVSGPAYAPESLVEPPLVAGPSALWVANSAHTSRAPSNSQGRQ